MTQAQFCRAAKLTPGAISRYLGGTRGTKIDWREVPATEKVALALGVRPDHFVEYRAGQVRQITFADPGLWTTSTISSSSQRDSGAEGYKYSD